MTGIVEPGLDGACHIGIFVIEDEPKARHQPIPAPLS